ncbi:glycosyltransferase family 4 protein [Aquiflexum sp. TKW24L]|uniref:glycosyltransferase family 4 protein n=1 Tax=Aquiflexum sp. TKW24L TaxID=2942212 RepID=UPI0020C101F1|nr:glycosyltransferase family 4 protein [Aquiflexum sp. TKW24L]MCL6260781.1 glycosyltransferase family 4 protein [Aquiflexum sp. TKW24L]
MKVLFPYTGDTIGGSHWSSLGLIKGLKEKGVDVSVIMHQENKKLESMILTSTGEKPVIFPLNNILKINHKKNLFFFMIFEMPRLIKYVKSSQVCIIHSNDNRIHIGWTLVAKISKVRHVFHLRNSRLPFFGYLSFLKKFPSAYVYLSEFNGKPLENFKNIKIKIPNPIVVSEHTNRKKLTEIINLGFIGNLEKRKRFDLFLEICDILNKNDRYKFKFNVFGNTLDFPINSILKKFPNLNFFGFVPDVDLVYSQIDILICPSDNEPLGRTILEAMSKKIPVIASTSGGNMELLSEGKGFLVAHQDPKDYVLKIEMLLNNWEFVEKELNKAFDFVQKNYSLEESSSKIISLYNQLLVNNINSKQNGFKIF